MSATVRLTSVHSGISFEVTGPWSDDEAAAFAERVGAPPAPREVPDEVLGEVELAGALPVFALAAEVVP